ncbi:MAG: prolyl oligopeptidase family serine peptidase [Chitinophagaceae bacterium]|nr:prolyl oligopeptidase family serine peptidase [Chitinophagaceae bacterium]
MKNLIILVIMFFTLSVSAQDTSLYLRKEYVNAEGKVLPYRILYPENYDKSKKYPVILFLHGAGERGNDNTKQLTHGSRLFLADSNRKKFPCFVIIPQCPQDGYWSSAKIDRSTSPITIGFDYEATGITWPLQSAIDIVKQLTKDEKVDRKRIYITGLSMGGMGTFEAVYRNPDLFATALPICGGGDTVHYDNRVKAVPFWIFHGNADAVVNVNLSRSMVAKLKASGVNVKYTEYPGVNHNSWDNAFVEPTYLSWMFSQKRKKVKW